MLKPCSASTRAVTVLANHTIIEAFAAQPFVLGPPEPSPLEPERLPKRVRYRCATPRRNPCAVRRSKERPLGTGLFGGSLAPAAQPTGVLPATEPTLQIGSVDDAENQDHAVGVDEVVHHPVVADTQSVEGVLGATDGLDRLARHTSGAGDVMRESFEGSPDAIPVSVAELPELSRRRTRKPDLVGAQSRSSSLSVRPLA